MRNSTLLFLCTFGILNVVLYSGLMPLWEGFDEPFHYGYVQNLSVYGQLPMQGQASVSREIRRSMELTPASHVVQRNIPWLMTFDRYFALPLSERRAMQDQLWQMTTDLRRVPDEKMRNYEAQQAPLAYLLLAVPDRLFSGVALPLRILILRIFCGMAALLATLLLMRRLLRDCLVPQEYQFWALAMLLCSQMFYASVCRVSNEWLAVPLGAWLFSAAIRFYQQTSRRRAVELGLALGAGLLTKGYFLSLVPFVLCLVVVAAQRFRPLVWTSVTVFVAAGPWYIRNLWMYGSLSGLMEPLRHVTLAQTVQAFDTVHWPTLLLAQARSAIWMGNNSMGGFSATTSYLALGLLGIVALVAIYRDGPYFWILAGGLCSYAAGLIYMICVFASALHQDLNAPWYLPVIFPAALCLLSLGLPSSGYLAKGLLGFWCYLIGATYLGKLIPLYSGAAPGRTTFQSLLETYSSHWGTSMDNLSALTLLPADLLLALAGAVAIGAILLWREGLTMGVTLTRNEDRTSPLYSLPDVRALDYRRTSR